MRSRGFTLVEIVITLAVVLILAMVASPPMSAWWAGARIKGVAEQLQNSLRLAQSEAMRRGRQTAFVLTNATPAAAAQPSTNGKNWYVQALPLLSGEALSDADAYVMGSALNADMRATITGPAVLCFNSYGRQTTNASTGLGSNCTAQDQTYSVNVASLSSVRTFRVTVSLGGQVRMCDTAKTLSTTSPDGC